MLGANGASIHNTASIVLQAKSNDKVELLHITGLNVFELRTASFQPITSCILASLNGDYLSFIDQDISHQSKERKKQKTVPAVRLGLSGRLLGQVSVLAGTSYSW